ncbi:MAG: ATP-binding cassette domain-containing protein [Clostridia bacterium]|nr:ATP-binding cassette domain-containing protein [Clostridia bacterium]
MIEISNIVKKYGNLYAVNNISFKVNEGEIVGFLGPNGAGKSTTMNILTGYLSATSGSAKIGGVDILSNPIEAKRMIGFLPEQPPLYLDMTVKEYLNFVYDLKHCTLNRKKHLAEICEVVKIGDVYNRIIGHLSKGYRQRVGIAQALVGNPKVLIFDEPTVGLDPKQIIEIRNLIRSLGEKHTVILSTHILPEVQAVCDRIVVINKGQLVADAPTSDIGRAVKGTHKYTAKICGDTKTVLKVLNGVDGILRAEPVTEREEGSYEYAIESDASIEVRKPLFYALCDARLPLIGLESAQANLEDVFISIIDDNKKEEN